MRKVFLLVMMGLLLVLSVSCKSKNERILEEVKKKIPSDIVYRKNILTMHCTDMSSLTKNNVENTEKCRKIISDTEAKYNKKFLSLLDFYKDKKMSMEEIQELYNKIEVEQVRELGSKVLDLTLKLNDSYDLNNIITYQEISITSLLTIDMSEEPGIYASKIEEIKHNNDIKWQKDTAVELRIRSTLIMEKKKIPEFSDPEVRRPAEIYLEFLETCKIYALFKEKEELLKYNEENSEKVRNDLMRLTSNISNEDKEKLFNYLAEKREEVDKLFMK